MTLKDKIVKKIKDNGELIVVAGVYTAVATLAIVQTNRVALYKEENHQLCSAIVDLDLDKIVIERMKEHGPY